MNNFKLKTTVDYSRIKTSMSHTENAMAIAFRELIHNAQAYNAKNVQLFQMKKGNDLFCGMGHDGKPFSSLEEIKESLEFNKSGGHGVQGSGMKTAMYPLSGSIQRSKLIIFSKTPQGKFSCKLSHENNSQTNVKIEDVTDEWNKVLKKFLHTYYNDYNVIYLYRYKNDKNVEKSILNVKNICNFIQITPSIDENITIRYNRLFYNENDIIDYKKYNLVVKKKNVLNDIFKLKTYKIDVNDVKHTIIDEDIENKEVKYNARIDLDIYPMFIKKDTEKAGNMIIGKNGQTFIANGINMNDLHQNIYYVYHDYNLGGNNKRANIDPFYFGNKKSGNFLMMELGIDPLPIDITNPNIEIAKEYFSELNEDLKLNDVLGKWRPVLVMNVYIKNVKNLHNDLGSLDNFFYTLDRNRVRSIVKSILNKANNDNSNELNEFKKYYSNFLPDDKTNEYLPVIVDTKGTKAKDVDVIITNNGYNQSKNYIWKDKKPKSPNQVITRIPVNVDGGIEVKIEDRKTQEFFNCEIDVEQEGLKIHKHPMKSHVYTIYTSDYYHYEKNDEGLPVKVPHTPDEHSRIKNIRTSYPNKNYIIFANGKKLNLGLQVEVSEIKERYNVVRTLTNRRNKEIDDIYRNWNDNKHIIARYYKGKVLLNKSNLFIKKLAKNKNNKFKNKFSLVYQLFHEEALNIYTNSKNILQLYKINANSRKIEDDYGDIETLMFNQNIEKIVQHNSICRELIDDYEKKILNKTNKVKMLEKV